MTDLCQEERAQSLCHEAVKNAVQSDESNPEAYHVATSYLISSRQFDDAKIELQKSLNLWLDDHEPDERENETEEDIIQEMTKNKLDPELRMNALRNRLNTLTLLMAQWVDMEVLEYKNHASLVCFVYSLGAIRQISSLESASSRVVTHQHALSA